jgi:hypothetical protein
MQRGVELRTFSGAHTPPGVYDDLIAIMPEVASPYRWFYAVLSESDPRLPYIYDVLAKYDIQVMPSYDAPNYNEALRCPKGHFTRRYLHLFTQQEIDSARYMLMLCADAKYHFARAQTSSDGRKRVFVPANSKSQKLLASAPTFFCHEKFRPHLEAEQFVGLKFEETIPVKEMGGRLEDFKEVEWISGIKIFGLTSDIELSPMPDSHVKKMLPAWEGTRFGWVNPGFDDICAVYRRGDIEQVSQFDFASTWEQMPLISRPEAWPIVSQRFRQFCLKHKMRFEFVPVKYVD